MDNTKIAANQDEAETTHEALTAARNDLAVLHDRTISVIKEVTASNRSWDVVKTILPVLLTAFLGFLIWNAQAKIQGKVDENNRFLQARMALTEDFNHKKLEAYVDTCTKMADMRNSLEFYKNKEFDPDVGKRGSDSVYAVYKLPTLHALFLGDEFKNSLREIYTSGVDRMKDEDDESVMPRINTQISEMEKRMQDDLRVQGVIPLPQPSGP